MKNHLIFAFAFFTVILFANQSPADDFTYFSTTLSKDYIKQGGSSSDKIEIKINLYTRINPLKKNDSISSTWKIHSRACKFFKRRGWTVRDPFFEASDAGSILSVTAPFACTYSDAWPITKYSLRSSKESESCVDVSEIAKKYGGGGHSNAAGFTLPTFDISLKG